jgi:hypothetical protein
MAPLPSDFAVRVTGLVPGASVALMVLLGTVLVAGGLLVFRRMTGL